MPPHPRISINTLCFAPAGLGTMIEKVARLGVRGISPDLAQVLELGSARTAQALRLARLEVATLTHRAFAFANEESATLARSKLMRTITIAAEIGAASITMTTGGRGTLAWSEATERFAAAIAPCEQQARDAGIALAIEPTSHLYADASIAHRLSDTVQIARMAEIGIALDLFACWFDADIEAAITSAAHAIALVQVSDYVPGDRALPCRAVPGVGGIPLGRLIPDILQTGYRGWFDLEIIGPRLLAEGEEAGLRRAAQYLGGLLAE